MRKQTFIKSEDIAIYKNNNKMKIKRLPLLIIFLIGIMASLAIAWQDDYTCDTSTNCEVTVLPINVSNDYQIYTSAVCNLDVILISNGSKIVDNATMTPQASGFQNYTLNLDANGNYFYTVLCGFNGAVGREAGYLTIGNTAETDITSDIASINTTIMGKSNNIYSYLTNSSLTSSIWSYGTRTLTSIDWSIFTNWLEFKMPNTANHTVTYRYGTNSFVTNVTYANSTADGRSWIEKLYYDSVGFLTNATVSTTN